MTLADNCTWDSHRLDLRRRSAETGVSEIESELGGADLSRQRQAIIESTSSAALPNRVFAAAAQRDRISH